MNSKDRPPWVEFLNPDVMRPRLIAASIYIAGFEALKDSVVGRIRDSFCCGFDKSGDKIDPRYQSEVLSRNKSPVYASLNWLKEMNAINEADLDVFERVKACRNTLAHELLSTLSSEGLPPDFEQHMAEMVGLLRKIEVWWILNFELPSNPDFDGQDVDEDSVLTGPLVALQLLLDIALGDEERSRAYYNKFCKQDKPGPVR